MIMKLARDQVLQVMEQTASKYTENAHFIVVNKGDYRIQVSNTDFPTRIDVLGFFPPQLPAIKIVPRDLDYGRLLAQVDTEQAPSYILDLLRVILVGMSRLRTVERWSRETAPTLILDSVVHRLIISIHQNVSIAFEEEKRRRLLETVYKPKTISEAAKEFKPQPRYNIKHKSTPDLPILKFSDNVWHFDEYEDSGLIPARGLDKTTVPNGDEVKPGFPLGVDNNDTIKDVLAVVRTTDTVIAKKPRK
jgi:hypothetical protein